MKPRMSTQNVNWLDGYMEGRDYNPGEKMVLQSVLVGLDYAESVLGGRTQIKNADIKRIVEKFEQQRNVTQEAV